MIPGATLFAPNRAPPGPPHPATGADREGLYVAPARILIVEDNWLVAMETEASLEDEGYAVVGVAVSAEEAIEACETDRPDLVLMDIRLLGHRDGVDAAVEIRERFDIGSIFVSAHDDADVRARAAAARPLGWIVKPVTSSELIRLLAEFRKDGASS